MVIAVSKPQRANLFSVYKGVGPAEAGDHHCGSFSKVTLHGACKDAQTPRQKLF